MTVLDWESFRTVYIEEALTLVEIASLLGVSIKVSLKSKKHWGKKHPEVAAQRSANHARAMKGNQRGKKAAPDVVLDRTELSRLADSGLCLEEMARELDTSVWHVIKNLELYGISGEAGGLPRNMTYADVCILKDLEAFVPGVSDAAKRHLNDPEAYFDLLYRGLLQLMSRVWFIQDKGRQYGHFRSAGKLRKSHVAWGLNRPEMALSMMLLEEGVEHVRLYGLPGTRYVLDFYFQSASLAVEIDGAWHSRDAETKRRDKKKEKAISDAGMTLMRFSDKDAVRNTRQVVDAIKKAL